MSLIWKNAFLGGGQPHGPMYNTLVTPHLRFCNSAVLVRRWFETLEYSS